MIEPYRQRDKKKYTKNLFGMGSIIIGAGLIVEHIYMWGAVSFYDFIGHEWLGFILIIVGIVLNLDLSKKSLSKELNKSGG